MKIENLSKDYLPGTEITIYQDPWMFRMNTDTHLLGMFMKVNKGETVLDIGVNNGALLLYANQFEPALMIGVDIQERACVLAEYNLHMHNISNAEIICADIRDFKYSPVDVIVCNPPYFSEVDAVPENSRKIARNELYLPLDGLFKAFNSLLKDKGRCYMVHRVNRLNEIYRELLPNKLNIREMTMIFDETHDHAHGVLLEIVKGKKVQLKVNEAVRITR